MKKISIILSTLAFTTLGSVGVANAKDAEINEKAVNVKCFVELVGGGETISLWLVKPSQLKTLSQTIIGQEILLIPNYKYTGNQKKATIYKTKQCILEGKQFRSPRARVMDKELPR
jgi:hypothetical protein